MNLTVFLLIGGLIQVATVAAAAVAIRRSRRLRTALAARKKRFDDLAAVSSDWFWETDIQHRFTAITVRDAKFGALTYALGRTRQDIALRNVDDEDHWAAHLADLDNHRPFRDFEYRTANPEGGVRHVRVSGVPRIDERGVFKGFQGIATDITAEKSARAAEVHARREAELANRAKVEFLANMSHELRTPLNAIIGFSQVMQQNTFGPLGDERYRDYASDIDRSGRHLLEIIDDILSLSVVESGRLELAESDVDIRRTIAAVLRIIRPRAKAGAVILHDDVPRDLPLYRADERRLKQVLLNLLSNAVKFTSPGGHVFIRVTVQDSGALQVTVEDTGIGMSADVIDAALTPFGRAGRSDPRLQGTSGLGLSIAKALTESHDGVLVLNSQPGHGTMAHVVLPWHRRISSDNAAATAETTPSHLPGAA